MAAGNLRKWLAVGAGVGIEIGPRQLRVVVVRVRPSGARVLGATVIEGFGERPAAEWGAEYGAFMKKLGLSHLAAAVLLPRAEVIVRQLSLPAVADKDLDAAIGYQLEALHPYPEDEVAAAWKRIGGSEAVLVTIARRAAIERYSGLFAEAGIKVASFTVSAAALYSALRLLAPPPADFVACSQSEEGLEVYGESASRPLFSAFFDLPPQRALPLAASELRLDPAREPLPLEQLLPAPRAVPQNFEFSPATLAYATALAGACPRLALAANLLPAELRQSGSRAIYVPTLALAALLVMVAGGLALVGAVENRRYAARVAEETARLEPPAKRLASLDTQIASARVRTQLISDFRQRTRADLDALNELTRLLAPPAWIGSLELSRTGVTLAGEADQAAGLLKTLDASPLFRDSEFSMGISRVGGAEVFRIRAQREGAGR